MRYSATENKFKFEGFKVFRIEKHDNCSCNCIQKAKDCTRAQIYSSSECRCLCPDAESARQCTADTNKLWDNNECKCKCASVQLCSSGLHYSNITCRYVLVMCGRKSIIALICHKIILRNITFIYIYLANEKLIICFCCD